MDLCFKELKNKIKHGWGYPEFEAKFGLDMNALKKHIRRVCNREAYANVMIAQITANTKKKEKQMRQNQSSRQQRVKVNNRSAVVPEPTPKPEPELVSAPTPEPESTLETKSKPTLKPEPELVSAPTPKPEPTPETKFEPPTAPQQSSSDELAELQEREGALSQLVMELESKRKECLSGKRAENERRLKALTDELEELRASVKAKLAEFSEIEADDQRLKAEASELYAEIKGKKAELEEVRQRISQLKKLVILVGQDGTIAPFEETDVVLNDDGSEDLFWKLVQKKECEDIVVKTLRVLARLLCIARNAEPRVVEIISEIDGVEQAFAELSKSE